MARYITAFLCLLLVAFLRLGAQCTPSPSLSPSGPDRDSLVDGCQGLTYTDTVHFAYAEDTVIFGTTVPFDSIRFQALDIPDGLVATCSTPNCLALGASGSPLRECLLFSGIPVDSTVGTAMVKVRITAFITLFGSVASFSDSLLLPLRIHTAGSGACVPTANDRPAVFCEVTVSPSPMNGNGAVSIRMENGTNVQLMLTDLQGRQVCSLWEGTATSGVTTMPVNTASIPSGLYILTVRATGMPTQAVRFTICH